MYINVTIQLQGTETIGKTAETLADEILPICNGDEATDTINVTITQSATSTPPPASPPTTP